MRTLLLAALLASTVACGGGESTPDAGGDVDAAPPIDGGGLADAVPSDCPAATSYAGVAPADAEAFWFGDVGDPIAVVASATVGDGATGTPPDELQLEFYRGAGAFAGYPIGPGTYEISGDEAQYSTCGVCVLLVANVSPALAAARAPDDPDADYLATAGTVEIISVDPTFEVRVHDLEFTRVDIDDSTYQSTPTADGCASVLPEATVTTASNPFPGVALRGAHRRR